MDRNALFERNIKALSQRHPELCSRLRAANPGITRYHFLESRSGETIPALIDVKGSSRPLHSTMDPKREAKRLIDTTEEGFLVFLGLGGAYLAEAALERDGIGMALVIEYDLNGLAELLSNIDYSCLFEDPRFRLLVDNSKEETERNILNLYQPALFGGIRVIPLRSRTDLEAEPFIIAGNAITAAIEKISADYSVQAHFGKRWFSNIIRNLKAAEKNEIKLPRIDKTARESSLRFAVCGAGPSLSAQIKQLRSKRNELFLISSDTSLPCLLNEGIIPDAVISIDCQHISYHHFFSGLPEDVILFLDLASPPLLASRFENHCFFTGPHPLTHYISMNRNTMFELDTSGGNVTYAAISLAERLGAAEIELYGADFSYPMGISYARGSYIYSFFDAGQNRLSPREAQASAFLFRTALEKKYRPLASGNSWYYETNVMKLYRERLEEKSKSMESVLIPVEGMGAPIQISPVKNLRRNQTSFPAVEASSGAEEFLQHYRDEIVSLREPGKNAAEYLSSLKGGEQTVFATILPAIAALKRRSPGGDFRELFMETKGYCLKEINRVLSE